MWQYMLGMGVSLIASNAAADAQAAAGRYNKAVADRNAAVLDQKAQQEIFRTGQEIVRFREQFSDLQAQTGSAFRYNNVVASSGTALDVLLENAQQADADVEMMRYNGAARASDLEQEGVNQRLKGEVANLEAQIMAKTTRMQGFMSFGNSLMSGAESGMFS